jgi:hypothetical protein
MLRYLLPSRFAYFFDRIKAVKTFSTGQRPQLTWD